MSAYKRIGRFSALEKELGTKLLIPPEPQIVGALGAAVVTQKSLGSGKPITGTA
jgi:activator of 2-hydroxyglutaryl-CoA dehydratase